MSEKPDAQLLRDYAQTGDEAAFREIVARHTDLIYSAALRQMSSPDLARDVAQSVFTDLARKADSLAETLLENASLLGWLYRGTRYAALRQLRDDRRRHARERQVMEQLDPASEPATDWDRVHPLLDEAMADLSDEDREAVLLRYFKNHDFRAIGASLGVSEDAAQKRVSRALEKLRADFARRGATTTALALSTALSANAVTPAPAGLAATFSNAALAGKAVAVTATITKTIAMTTIQKTLIAATIAIVAGAGFYEARRAATLREQVQALQQKPVPSAELQELQRERDTATNQVAALLDEIATLKKNSGELPRLRREVTELRSANKDSAEVAAKAWADRVAQLKQRLAQTPGAAIPELKYLSDESWLNAAQGSLDTDKDFRRAFSSLRHVGENQFIILMQDALKNYLQQSGGQFPSDIMQLKPFFDTPPDDAALQRYAVVPASTIPNIKVGNDSVITVKDPIDPEFDALWSLGSSGFGSTTYKGAKEASVLAPALKAYADANNGAQPTQPSDILPYLTTPEQQAAYQKLQGMRSGAGK